MLGIGNPDESDACVLGNKICRLKRAELVNDQRVSVLRDLRDHCVMVLTAFLTRAFPPPELAIQNLPGHDARMWVGECGVILFLLPQYKYNLLVISRYKISLKGCDLMLCLHWPYKIFGNARKC